MPPNLCPTEPTNKIRPPFLGDILSIQIFANLQAEKTLTLKAVDISLILKINSKLLSSINLAKDELISAL